MWKFLQTVELLTKIIDISNICVFFINGVYPSLLYRLLDVRTVRYAHKYDYYLCCCQVTMQELTNINRFFVTIVIMFQRFFEKRRSYNIDCMINNKRNHDYHHQLTIPFKIDVSVDGFRS
jgi:hypothetical protein